MPARSVPVAVLDLEMTGLDTARDRVCEVAVVRREGERIVEFQSLVRPPVPMGRSARRVHGLSDADVADAPDFRDIADEVFAILDGAAVVAHNVHFDLLYLARELAEAGRALPSGPIVDTLLMSRRLFAFRKNDLTSAAAALEVPQEGAHRALVDARTTLRVYDRMLEVIDPVGVVTMGDLLELVDALAPNSPLRQRQAQVLADAFARRRTVWIRYQSMGSASQGVTHREVATWRLRLPRFQGWCYLREGVRVFRLDRVRSVREGERSYEVPERFEARI